jgi:hypothetical protein
MSDEECEHRFEVVAADETNCYLECIDCGEEDEL